MLGEYGPHFKSKEEYESWLTKDIQSQAEIDRLRAALKDAVEVLEWVETESGEQSIAGRAGRAAERCGKHLSE